MRIIVDIPGGFGNQLFGYAFGYALSKELGDECEFCIHTPFQDSGVTWELQIDKLNIRYDKRITYNWGKRILDRVVVNRLKKMMHIGILTRTIRENVSFDISDYCMLLEKRNNVIFYGNWENERFFSKYRADLLEMFTEKVERNNQVKEILLEAKNNMKSVGMHIRMGDKAEMGISLSSEYYNACIEAITKYIINPCIYIISDDIAWCKSNLASKNAMLIYPDYDSDNRVLDDWLILKACNNHIVANSTFSWWAAWLNQNDEQVIICPKQMGYKLDKWICI